MAFERLGFGGVLEVNENDAVASLGRAGRSFDKLKTSASTLNPALRAVSAGFSRLRGSAARVGAGMRKIGSGFQSMAGSMFGASLATAGLTAGFGAGILKAAQFEKAMSGVGAILGKIAEDQMPMLTKEAQRLGIVSVFSASQAAGAMENLARAGFNANEIMGALEGTMNAAAAEGIELATAADIVANQVRAFGLETKEATRVADVLALASAKANTTIVGLGEGLKFVAPISRGLGVSLEESTTALALLADSGLKGTLAGTALKNAMLKLAAPTGKAAKRLEQLGLQVATDTGDFVGLQSILKQLQTGMGGLGGKVNQTAAAAELFGLRGVALTNLLGRLDKGASGTALTFDEFLKKMQNAGGAAKEMADLRLNNLIGKVTLLMSSLEALSIQLFGPLLKRGTNFVKRFTDGLNQVLFVMQDLNQATDDQRGSQSFLTKLTQKFGRTATSVAMGLKDAMNTLGRAWNFVLDLVNRFRMRLEESLGSDMLRKVVKIATLVAAVGAAFTPVLLTVAVFGMALGAIGPVVSGLISVISGMVTVVGGLLSGPMLVAIGAVVAGFLLIRRENESILQTLVRVWGVVKETALDLWHNVLVPVFKGIWEVAGPSILALKDAWIDLGSTVKSIILDIATIFGVATDGISFDWKIAGQTIGMALKIAVGGLSLMAGWVKTVVGLVQNLVRAWREIFAGDLLTGIKRLAAAIADGLLLPIRLALQAVIKLAEALDIGIPTRLKTLALEGVTGLTFPDRGREPLVRMIEERAQPLTQQIAMAQGGLTAAAGAPPAVPTIKNEVKLDIDNKLMVDGRETALASARHKATIQDRAGFKATPWQRRMMLEQGAAPVGTKGG